MDNFKFVVQGDPRSKARPRVVRGRTFTPKTTMEAEASVAAAASDALEGVDWDFTGPMRLDIDFYMKTARLTDCDNLAKLVMDAIQGLVFENDSQVSDLHVRRFNRADEPRTEVSVWRI
jgi:Holliday junction resolvase RusA-like endonuclease